MDGIGLFGLGQRQLQLLSAEGVAPVPQAVWPRHQRLASGTGAKPVQREAVEDVALADGVGPDRSAHLDHRHPLIAAHQVVLSAARRLQEAPHALRSARAGNARNLALVEHQGAFGTGDAGHGTRVSAVVVVVLPQVGEKEAAPIGIRGSVR